MAITLVKQSGNRVSVKFGNSNMAIDGTLIGYTSKAIFVTRNRNLHIYVEKGGALGGCGHNITINSNEEVKMFGNLVGIKNGPNVRLYDENGRPAGTRRV